MDLNNSDRRLFDGLKNIVSIKGTWVLHRPQYANWYLFYGPRKSKRQILPRGNLNSAMERNAMYLAQHQSRRFFLGLNDKAVMTFRRQMNSNVNARF